VRRLAGKYNAFEMRMARRAGDAVPAIGFKAFCVLFWVLKFALLAALFFVAAYIALCLLIFFGLIALINRPAPVEVKNWDEAECSPNFFEEYGDDMWYDRFDNYGYSKKGAWDENRSI